ncbi:MAG: DUF1549 domain-containing protein [Bacteroidota bacterium]
MEVVSDSWFLSFLGRLHPMLVHFPVGILIAAFALEIWACLKKEEQDYSKLIYLGALSCLFAAVFGQLLYWGGDYAGELVESHQQNGLVASGLAILCAFIYSRKKRLPGWLPIGVLGISCVFIGISGHLGASITHGEDYLSFGNEESIDENAQATLAQFTTFSHTDTLSEKQQNKLNLEVRAIFAHRCYQCHSTAKKKGELALDDREGIFLGGENGKVLIPGNAEASELYKRINLNKQDEEAMPPKGKRLSSAEIGLVKLWIDQGAHWSRESLKIFPEAEMALEKPVLPKIDRFNQPVDKFLDHYFSQHNLKWPSVVTDRRFIRRVYLDILGLLPEKAAIEAFVKDKSLDKRERLIDRLLEENQSYALHWLSFWNDLLRNDYSGTGFITGGRKRITDWLYEALLEEKPYDQMVTELLNPDENSHGFLQGIKWRGVVNSSQSVEMQAAQNVSQTFLGLNLKCASCHDSFVNNVSLDQAYAFANIFADTLLEIHRCDKPTARYSSPAFIYPELGEVNADNIKDRLEQLAKVVVQPNNGRLYRTLVNRYWDKLFGRGIISPVDEMDNKAWNQELLDWLATDFIEGGYSLKKLLARIMKSKAYQLESQAYASANYVKSEQFVFQGPLPRRLSAEQFADAISQQFQPLYYGAAFIPGKPAFPAKWIWFRDKEVDRSTLPKPGVRYFRKKFKLNTSEFIRKAEILVTADHSFQLFLNEKQIGKGDDWRKVHRISIGPEEFTSDNILAVQAANEGSLPNPAGVLLALKYTYENGQEEYLYSNRDWISTDSLPPTNWRSYAFSDENWEKVVARSSSHYWGKLLDFSFGKKLFETDFLRASLVQQDPFLKTLGRPSRENVATDREEETTMLQALMLTNDTFLHKGIQESAERLLSKLEKGDDIIDYVFYSALGRMPTERERKSVGQVFSSTPEPSEIEDLIWSVILLPEFQYL